MMGSYCLSILYIQYNSLHLLLPNSQSTVGNHRSVLNRRLCFPSTSNICCFLSWHQVRNRTIFFHLHLFSPVLSSLECPLTMYSVLLHFYMYIKVSVSYNSNCYILLHILKFDSVNSLFPPFDKILFGFVSFLRTKLSSFI